MNILKLFKSAKEKRKMLSGIEIFKFFVSDNLKDFYYVIEIQLHNKKSLRLEEIGCCKRTDEIEIKHQKCYHEAFVNRFMIVSNTFNKLDLQHLSRSGYLLQSIQNGQRNYPYEVSKSAMLNIFKMCISDKRSKV